MPPAAAEPPTGLIAGYRADGRSPMRRRDALRENNGVFAAMVKK